MFVLVVWIAETKDIMKGKDIIITQKYANADGHGAAVVYKKSGVMEIPERNSIADRHAVSYSSPGSLAYTSPNEADRYCGFETLNCI